jgi:hypothetical protein
MSRFSTYILNDLCVRINAWGDGWDWSVHEVTHARRGVNLVGYPVAAGHTKHKFTARLAARCYVNRAE